MGTSTRRVTAFPHHLSASRYRWCTHAVINGEKEEIRFIYGSEFAFETQIFIDRIQTRSVTDSWSEEISLRILKTIDR